MVTDVLLRFSFEAPQEVVFDNFKHLLDLLYPSDINSPSLLEHVDEETRPCDLLLLHRAAERHLFFRQLLELRLLVAALDAGLSLVHQGLSVILVVGDDAPSERVGLSLSLNDLVESLVLGGVLVDEISVLRRDGWQFVLLGIEILFFHYGVF